MPAFRRLLFAALACTAICLCSPVAAAVSSATSFATPRSDDESIAERVLGPHWKQLSRRAGMIFAGTVVSASSPKSFVEARLDRAVPAMELSFRVDHPIVGVKGGQILTIHEWTGAQSLQRPLRPGEHILLFLYRPSRLGLTSPVGGWRGQITLDSSGQQIVESRSSASSGQSRRSQDASRAAYKSTSLPITVVQLERAIRAARGE